MAAFFAVAAMACLGASSAPAANLPTSFADELVASVLSPTALAFTPDGRLLITAQQGRLYVRSGAQAPNLVLDLTADVCSTIERGLLGVAVDPSYATNHFVYLFYTHSAGGCFNRVSRFVLAADSSLDRNTETILVDNIPSTAGNHNAGDLHFGSDGYLYVSVGDGGCDYNGDSGCNGLNDASRDQNVLLGKILRITRDGGVPADNPFIGPGTGSCASGAIGAGLKCQETYAWGLRNPFRFAFAPSTSTFFINDVGQGSWEEIDLGQAGADYGWNTREGHCAMGSTTDCGPAPAGMTNPIFDYLHENGCTSITGGTFVPRGVWPSAYDDAYLFSDYACGSLFQLSPQLGGGFTKSTFADGFGGSSIVTMIFGPAGSTQALYYTTYSGGGEVRRILYTGRLNRNPSAALSGTPSSGTAPLDVTLDAGASTDPDGDMLQYAFDFGDGTGTPASGSSTATHRYATGRYTATVTVTDGRGGSAMATASIQSGNTAPSVTIGSPLADSTFYVGQPLNLHATATDAEDGSLPNNSLSWTVIRHHDTHTHPFLGPVSGNDVAVTGPAPEDLQAAANSYLEIRVTATDSGGLATTVVESILPAKVVLTFASAPSGLQLNIAGAVFTAPATVTSWQGWQFPVSAPNQTDSLGRPRSFSSWSDGGARQHNITTPGTASTYTAAFVGQTGGGLLTNGSFEGSLTGWIGKHADLSLASDGIDGTQAAKITYNDTNGGFSIVTSARPVRTTAGKPYHAWGFLRTDSGPRRLCLILREFSASGTIIGFKYGCINATSSWQQVPALSYTTQQSGGTLDLVATEEAGAQVGDSFEVDALRLSVSTPGGFLTNASFEGSLTGWIGKHADLSLASDGIDGTQAAKITYNDTNGGFSIVTSARPVRTTTGSTYKATGFMRTDSGPRRLCLILREFNASGFIVGSQYGCINATSSWQQIPALSYTAQQSNGTLDLVATEETDATNGASFEVDGLRLSVSTPAGGFLTNGSFEGSLTGWVGRHADLLLASDGIDGTQAAKVTYNDTSGGFSIVTSARPVHTAAGSSYSAQGFLRTDSGPRRLCLILREFEASGAIIGSQYSCINATSSWQQVPALNYTTQQSGGTLDLVATEETGAQAGDSFEVDGLQLIALGGSGDL